MKRWVWVVIGMVTAFMVAGCDEMGGPEVKTMEKTGINWVNYKSFQVNEIKYTNSTFKGPEKIEEEKISLHPLIVDSLKNIVQEELSKKGYNISEAQPYPDLQFYVMISVATGYTVQGLYSGTGILVQLDCFDAFGRALWRANVSSLGQADIKIFQSLVAEGIKAFPARFDTTTIGESEVAQ